MSLADLRHRLDRAALRTPRPARAPMTTGEMRRRLEDITGISSADWGQVARDCEAGGLSLSDCLRAALTGQVAL